MRLNMLIEATAGFDRSRATRALYGGDDAAWLAAEWIGKPGHGRFLVGCPPIG